MAGAADPEPFPPQPMREAIRASIDPGTLDEPPAPRYFYVPARHVQALALDRPLVLGIRGAGKSVWWKALQDPDLRRVAATWLRDDPLDRLDVKAGFGRDANIDAYPDADTLTALLSTGAAPLHIWRAVVARHTWEDTAPPCRLGTWRERVAWVAEHPEEVARGFQRRDEALRLENRRQLVLFDTLERTARNWPDVLKLLRGLLEVLLDFRGYRNLRAKAFVRPDMLKDPLVTAFPESSKITAGSVELRWNREDLYGLLFQRLGNEPTHGAEFRHGCGERGGGVWPANDGTYAVPPALRDDVPRQTAVFHALAWKWMGPDQRRGFPYSWLHGHLADALDQVSPRSFLAAVRAAAEATPHDYRYALYYEAIKRGVQKASTIRVEEVAEDFGWIRTVMAPLKGLVVPCSVPEARKVWRTARVVAKVRALPTDEMHLPPRQVDRDEEGLLDDLIELGLFSRMRDLRLNMPDVYRVAFGLGRRGGVKPVR
jgi:hypothetical protein